MESTHDKFNIVQNIIWSMGSIHNMSLGSYYQEEHI